MNKTLSAVNELFSEVFNDILRIEEKTLRNGVFKDISLSEVHTVEVIGMYEPKNMSDVAKKLNITVGTLTVAINKLVRKGYVKRERSSSDRRVVNVSLTNKGRVLYRFHAKFHSDMIREVILELTEQEIGVLNSALSNLSKYLLEKYNNLKRGEVYV